MMYISHLEISEAPEYDFILPLPHNFSYLVISLARIIFLFSFSLSKESIICGLHNTLVYGITLVRFLEQTKLHDITGFSWSNMRKITQKPHPGKFFWNKWKYYFAEFRDSVMAQGAAKHQKINYLVMNYLTSKSRITAFRLHPIF